MSPQQPELTSIVGAGALIKINAGPSNAAELIAT